MSYEPAISHLGHTSIHLSSCNLPIYRGGTEKVPITSAIPDIKYGASSDKHHIMIKMFFTLGLLLSISSTNIAQNTRLPLSNQIRAVENGLMPNMQLQDSSLKKFNLLDRMAFYKVPAVSIAVVDNGQLAWARAYGVGNRDKNTPLDTHSLFWAGSISKSITALGVMKLVENGTFSLEKDFREYVKSWTFKENDLSKDETITLQHLLSHTAGLNRGNAAYFRKEPLPTLSQVLMGQKPAKEDGVFSILKPGTAYKYSNLAFGIVQKMIEDNVEANFGRFIQSTVCSPIGMENSLMIEHQLPAAIQAQSVDGHWFSETIPFGESEQYITAGASNLWTTPGDLAKFIIAVQAAYNGQPGAMLQKATAQRMLTPVLANANSSDGQRDSSKCALGFFIYDLKGEKYFSHSGGTDGFRALYFGSLEGGKGAVVMVNANNASILFEIFNSIATVYDWKNYYQPKRKKTVVLDDKILERYCGQYNLKLKDGDYIRVIRKRGNHLEIVNGKDETGERLYFSSETEAFLLSRKTNYQFILSNEKVKGLIAKEDGRFSGEAKRIK